ncbi:MAG: hypothetical protein IJT23_01235 [Clostridia bacterium]|nr:hypothetical protein [Clostridia bacterium]
MKKSFIFLVSAILAVSMLGGCGKKTADKQETKTEDKTSTSSVDKSDMAVVNGEEKQVSDNGKFYLPQVMYFVSASDETYDAEIKAFNELKDEYKDIVEFDLRDIDKNPEDKEKFPVEGMTPTLIMLDTANNISAMEFKCSDKAKLKESIENAFNGMQEDIEKGKVNAQKRAE